MILTINTTNPKSIQLGLYDGQNFECRDIATEKQSADLLPAIDQILKEKELSKTDLSAILVDRGPGSYTGTRVGVTTANVLAWSLNIPVMGYRNGEIEKSLQNIKIDKNGFSKITLPIYEK